MFAKLVSAIVLVTSVGVLGACSGDDDVDAPVMPGYPGTGGTPATGTTVNVTLREYLVTLTPNLAGAGAITFSIYNQGTETHEFVVVQTALPIENLPTSIDGSFDEEGAGVQVLDEIETIPAGSTQQLTVSLVAGPYVLLCNRIVTEGDELESHFHEGMLAAFTVE